MNALYRVSLAGLRLGLLPYWIPLLEGKEHLPRDGPALLVCNHPTVLDGLLLGTVLPRPIRFLISREPLRVPGVGWWLRTLGFIPTGGSTDKAVECLRRGQWVGIFPEARPTHSYTLQAFHPGVARLARLSQAAVIPVTIFGSEELCPADCRWVRGGHVRIRFGAPLAWRVEDTEDAFLDRLRSAIAAPLQNPAPLPAPSGWRYQLARAVWAPSSWLLLKLADRARPGGRR